MDLRRAIMMAVDCMNHHRLYNYGWQFKLDNAKRRMGVCRRHTRTIGISKPNVLVNSEDVVLDTILHEIAHALLPPGCNHGPVWQAMAREVGAEPKSCGGQEAVAVTGDWQGKCTDCGRLINRYKKPQPYMLRTGFHVACKRKQNNGKINWSYKNKPLVLTTLSSTNVLLRTMDTPQQSV